VLLYAVLIANLAALVAYILFSYGQLLLENLSYQNMSVTINRNLEQKARLSISYDRSLNQDGSGFTNTILCPASVTLSGTVAKSTIATAPLYTSGAISCSGTTASGVLNLTYNSAFTGFVSATYVGVSASLTATAFAHAGSFANTDLTNISFTVGGAYSALDANQNSDNWQDNSSGAVAYPNGLSDNDALARLIFYGVIQKNAGFGNVFYLNADTNAYAENNANNTGTTLGVLPSKTSVGYVVLDADGPF